MNEQRVFVTVFYCPLSNNLCWITAQTQISILVPRCITYGQSSKIFQQITHCPVHVQRFECLQRQLLGLVSLSELFWHQITFIHRLYTYNQGVNNTDRACIDGIKSIFLISLQVQRRCDRLQQKRIVL